jgi:hypothetical protein
MNRRIVYILAIAGLIISLNAGLIFSQPEEVSTEPPSSVLEVMWLWGEVSSVDAANKTLTVRYIDYDTDIEKQMTITADKLTTFENIGSFEEIKIMDTVSIDYATSVDGKNIAKNISVEKIEEDIGEALPEDFTVVPEKVGSKPSPENLEPPLPAAEETGTISIEKKTDAAIGN